MLARFADWCHPAAGWRTLDVGSGPGLFPALLARRGCRAVGLDLDAEMLAQALHPALLRADGRRLPFASATFDLVTASNVLYLDLSPLTLLGEMRRVLPPGGSVAVLNPSEHLSVAAAARLADERRLEGLARETLLNFAARAEQNYRWTEAELARLFAAAGLELRQARLSMGEGLVRFARGVVGE